MRSQAYELGKEYDENLVRRVINFGLRSEGKDALCLEENVPNGEHFGASEARARLLRQDDVEARLEADEFAKRAKDQLTNNKDLSSSNDILTQRIIESQRQIDEQAGQIRELMSLLKGGATEAPAAPKPAAAAAHAPAAVVDSSRPNADWTKRQIVEYARSNALSLPEGHAIKSKLTILEFVLEQLPTPPAED
jgi:hypothetical protein